jgi:Methyltransferase domain
MVLNGVAPIVKLRQYECVVARLLRKLRIVDERDHPILSSFSNAADVVDPVVFRYIVLPSIPRHSSWQHDAQSLLNGPDCYCVHGAQPGQIANFDRARRKAEQIHSIFRCIHALLPPHLVCEEPCGSDDDTSTEVYTICDLGGGSGHLALPLALHLRSVRVIVVELSQESLRLLHNKAKQCSQTPDSICTILPRRLQKTAVPNLFTYCGAIESLIKGTLPYAVDMVVGLHLCGQVTDVALQWAAKSQVSRIILAPCCVGKLQSLTSPFLPESAASSQRAKYRNPYIYQATGQNEATVQYPQSARFRRIFHESTTMGDADRDWNSLAKAADYNSTPDDCFLGRHACRRVAKVLLEYDRCLLLQEHGYDTTLTRMQPVTASPKNDIILAWKRPVPPWNSMRTNDSELFPMEPDRAIVDDLAAAVEYIEKCLGDESPLTTKQDRPGAVPAPRRDSLQVEWSGDEIKSVEKQLVQWMEAYRASQESGGSHAGQNDGIDALSPLQQSTVDNVLVFPTRLGRRKRKLLHYVAERMGLAHWSVGSKHAEKTVAVRIPPGPSAAATDD